jgi:hypothetical protein
MAVLAVGLGDSNLILLEEQEGYLGHQDNPVHKPIYFRGLALMEEVVVGAEWDLILMFQR